MTLGTNCSSGCPTKDHKTFGACLKAKHVGTAYISPNNNRTREKRWQRDIDYYRSAKRQGLNPEGSSRAQVEAAFRAAEANA